VDQAPALLSEELLQLVEHWAANAADEQMCQMLHVNLEILRELVESLRWVFRGSHPNWTQLSRNCVARVTREKWGVRPNSRAVR
jgi:hypothetical protein